MATASEAFAALGLTDKATPDEVKAAWRKLAAIHHPDVGGDADEFSRLNRLYKQALEHAESPKICGECQGKGKVLKNCGFSSIELPCDVCGGEGTL